MSVAQGGNSLFTLLSAHFNEGLCHPVQQKGSLMVFNRLWTTVANYVQSYSANGAFVIAL